MTSEWYPLQGEQVVLRPAVEGDLKALEAIRATPEVFERWGGGEFEEEFLEDLEDEELHLFAIEDEGGKVLGAIQWGEEEDPQYRHANMDIYLDPSVHGRGLGSDAVRTLTVHLFRDIGHHRLVIDPAADNAAAIACYAKVGFREVGTMRQYERAPDGSWHDGVLMELLADEFPG